MADLPTGTVTLLFTDIKKIWKIRLIRGIRGPFPHASFETARASDRFYGSHLPQHAMIR